MVMFSIIVPCHNEEKNIVSCINSVLSQDYKDFEVIVVNDASTDNSRKLLDSFGKKIRIIDKKVNQGRPRGINDALKSQKASLLY